MASSDYGDMMFPDTPNVIVEESADYNLIPNHLNVSTHASSHSDDYNYFSYFSYSSYFLQYDFGLHHQDRTVIYIVSFFFLLLLILFGLLSNLFQLYGIVCFPRIRQDVQHIFIANMTIVDIMYLVLAGIEMLVVCAIEAFGHGLKFLHGADFVRLQIAFQIVHMSVLFHLASMITALAFDQYLIVVYPITARKLRTPRNAVIACVILWTVGFFLAIADGLSFIGVMDSTSIIDTVMLTKDSLIFILFCLVPTIMTIAFNMMTWYALQNARTATSTNNHHANNAQRFTQLQEDGGGVPGALVRAQDLPNNIAITASFAIFWGIFHIINLIIAFIWALRHFDHWIYLNSKDEVLIIIADLAVHFNVALNPLLYVACNPKFRQHLYQVAYSIGGRNTRAYTSHIDQTTTGE